MAYVIPEVKRLRLSRKKGETAVFPSAETAIAGTVPARAAPLPIHARDAQGRRPGVHRMGAG